ncbi:GlsB/YeaQ/YmgE family stress response membrane protein [Thiocystis minor]|uniref:GlsB/YeaQ/YmgE family stress response membrane protein n=1 Tax=Thiocystis minor TaxID=61597 RepID=UPI00191442D9|nr:GlsB/YeaQ/YmgE family stress response membrane protein [Thiocystis minor]MBK5964401.1 GlsB/YeaQ/YmgE family stress response membrane protein [Thiocystis minor]
MDITSLLIFLAIGAVAGWLAGLLMRGGGFGLLGNILVGIVGAVIGGFAFGFLGITASGLIGSIITATAGAVLLLFIIGVLKKAA